MDNFHPLWEEASKAVGGLDIELKLIRLIGNENQKYFLPEIHVAADEYGGLAHILFEDYTGLYLSRSNSRFYTRGISQDDTAKVALITLAMREYIKSLNEYLNFIKLAEVAVSTIKKEDLK